MENDIIELASYNIYKVWRAIKAEVDVNIKNEAGYTALMEASAYNQPKIVKLLIEAKAKLDLKDKKGWTALITATAYSRIKVVKLLIEAGAKLYLQDNFGKTALDYAKKQYNQDITTLLFEGSVNNKNFEKENLPIADIINKIAKLLDSDEIEIEIVGSWLWISDDSKQYKNEIKEAGFRFSGAKKMWFYCCKTEYKASKTNIDIDKLRLKYGSEILKNKSQLQEWFLNQK
jgi:ankyrin repeat protein